MIYSFIYFFKKCLVFNAVLKSSPRKIEAELIDTYSQCWLSAKEWMKVSLINQLQVINQLNQLDHKSLES